MKRPFFSPPDAFSIAPLLALLPVRGSTAELEKITASLFARFEKVRATKKALGRNPDRETQRRVTSEEAMLRQVLDWLSINTEEERDE